ncbi:uncharacterized protein LOC119307585 [Triticum dicoccoides]|uniref:uncharacterized protein LOC119307585 n=1 Tax=Triticum dicoccoides TaxID=85692 RepID=UPI00188E0014|nr:uncharacterized protein LOC119307585 [Triticum dicoccoides]
MDSTVPSPAPWRGGGRVHLCKFRIGKQDAAKKQDSQVRLLDAFQYMYFPLEVQATLRLLLASLGDAPGATPPRPRWEVRHRSVQRSKATARGRSPSQHPFLVAIVRCLVQLVQPTQVVALFATTAVAQTRAWSSSTGSSRGLRASPAHAYTKSTTLATLLVLALAYFLSNNPIASSWGKGSHVEVVLVLTRYLYSSHSV